MKPKSAAYGQGSTKRTRQITSDVPEAGQYEPHKSFGDIPQKVDFGSKYKFKPDSNPPPGFYDPQDHLTKNTMP